MVQEIRYAYFTNFRWRRQKGEVVGQKYSKWHVNEPDFVDFDQKMRKFSPLSQRAFDECGSNPSFSCVVNGSAITLNQNMKVTDKCALNSPSGVDGKNNKCGAGSGSSTTIFVNLAQIKRLTGESTPACMALIGPDLDTTVQTQNPACSVVSSGGVCSSEYNPGSLLFNMVENSALNLGYRKWMDVNCATKTKSLMCEMIGINIMSNPLEFISLISILYCQEVLILLQFLIHTHSSGTSTVSN